VAAPPLPTARASFASVVDANGTIYVLGGDPTDSAVIAFDGAAWSQRAAVPSPRTNIAGAVATDGSVFVIGGHDLADSVHYATVEAYAPASNAWRTLPSLNVARSDLAGALGPDGRVYAIGGFDGVASNAQVEAFRAGASAWLDVSPLSVGRDTCSVAVAADGRIVAFGGKMNSTTAYTSAEAYGPKITLGATTGAAGDAVSVTGANFAANARILVYFDALPVELATSDGNGALAAVTVHVPALASGEHRVRAMDDRSQYPVSARFVIR
jgi:hypothetical protein